MPSEETFNRRCKRGRDAEWDAIEPYLAERVPGSFLDVGCGTGYALARAKQIGFDVFGIDPEVSKAGVRDESTHGVAGRSATAVAETIPFADNTFDVVYSSHAIEHFTSVEHGIAEMGRVLKPDGRAVLMIPTGTMAAVRMPALWLFYSHRNIGKFLIRNRTLQGFGEVFFGPPHGTESRFAICEIGTFSIARWRATISKYFEVEHELRPCIYPWPDFPPLFPLMRLGKFSTSVVFICSKVAR